MPAGDPPPVTYHLENWPLSKFPLIKYLPNMPRYEFALPKLPQKEFTPSPGEFCPVYFSSLNRNITVNLHL